jgi:hypothetical protein
MLLPDGRHLGYCTNVHPYDDLQGLRTALSDVAVPLRARFVQQGRLARDAALGVGLWLPASVAADLARDPASLRAWMDERGLYAFTVNAFPFGDFHGARVKDDVYRPDWADARRAVYTLRAAVVLATLNASGARVSLSTVPLSFKPWRPSVTATTGRLLDMISALQGVERKSGVRPMLALEPEPFCLLETAADTVAYWESHLMPGCRAKFGRGAEDLARTYLGVCLDTCHHAVRWESSAEAVDLYRDAGIPIAKVQLSSALEAPSIDALAPFAEPRYLHQVVGRDGGARVDLAGDGGSAGEGEPLQGPVRCHFHVPVHKDRVAGVATTRDDMAAGLARALETGATACLEIETYTWDVLPQRDGALLD